MKVFNKLIHGFVWILVAVLPVSMASCKWTRHAIEYERGKTPIVEVRGEVLYEEDLRQVIPLGLSDADSALFASRYIQNWVQDILFYQNAIRNIPDTKEIDKLVSNYRRSLFEHEYQRKLIEQKFSTEITEDQIERFYNDNLRLFVLDKPLVKGLFLKIPNQSHDMAQIRELFTQTDDVSFEAIEKYCIQNNASRCEFFYDNWRSLSEIEVLLPPLDTPLETMLEDRRDLEFKDGEFTYLLNVSEFAGKGDSEPLEHARNRIRGLLTNSNEVAYMRKVKEDLYRNAVEKNLLIFHNKEK